MVTNRILTGVSLPKGLKSLASRILTGPELFAKNKACLDCHLLFIIQKAVLIADLEGLIIFTQVPAIVSFCL